MEVVQRHDDEVEAVVMPGGQGQAGAPAILRLAAEEEAQLVRRRQGQGLAHVVQALGGVKLVGVRQVFVPEVVGEARQS